MHIAGEANIKTLVGLIRNYLEAFQESKVSSSGLGRREIGTVECRTAVDWEWEEVEWRKREEDEHGEEERGNEKMMWKVSGYFQKSEMASLSQLREIKDSSRNHSQKLDYKAFICRFYTAVQ